MWLARIIVETSESPWVSLFSSQDLVTQKPCCENNPSDYYCIPLEGSHKLPSDNNSIVDPPDSSGVKLGVALGVAIPLVIILLVGVIAG